MWYSCVGRKAGKVREGKWTKRQKKLKTKIKTKADPTEINQDVQTEHNDKHKGNNSYGSTFLTHRKWTIYSKIDWI